jgi:hypothetical protein
MSGTEPNLFAELGMTILNTIVGVIVGYAGGLLTRRIVWRRLLKWKKWLANDVLSLDILAVRQYPYVEVRAVDIGVFDHIKSRFSNVKLVQKYPTGMIINVSPIFGNLEVTIDKNPKGEEDIYSEYSSDDKTIKLRIKTENPVRLGVRELGRLNELEKIVEGIFDTIDMLLFTEHKPMKQSYAVCDITRTIYFVQEKVFNLKDEDLGVSVYGKNNKLTITVSPIGKMTQATEKYHFS